MSKSAEKAGGGFGDFAKKASIGFAGVGVGAIALGKEVFELGNKLDIMKKKAATVFEDSLPMVQKWAKESATAMGLTRTQATGLAANFGDLLKPMGFTATQAAEMATKVVGLSGALSAWTGGTRTAADVSVILSKAMLGERESLKELGISILDADVKNRLLEKGQDDLTGSALEQAKAVASMELIFEKSKDAQKAFSDGQFEGQNTANQLKVKLEDLKETLAAKLYPWLVNLGNWMLTTGIPKMEEMATNVSLWWEKQDGLRAAIAKTIDFIEAEIKGLQTLIGWVKELASWIDHIDKWTTKWLGGGGGQSKILTDLQKRAGLGAPTQAPGETFVPGFASGGRVPGPRGMPRLIVAHGGERVQTEAQQRGGNTFIFEVNGREFARAIVDESNNSGGLPIRIRGLRQ